MCDQPYHYHSNLLRHFPISLSYRQHVCYTGISIINAITPFLNKIHFLIHSQIPIRVSQVAPVVKNPPANAGDAGDLGLIPGWRKSPGVGMTTHSSILPGESPRQKTLVG